MKRLYTFLLLFVMVFCTTSCAKKEVVYNAIYDTQTKQYISLSDSKEQVESYLGEGSGQNDGPYSYRNGLMIWYDDDWNVNSIRIMAKDTPDEQPASIYKFMDGFSCGTDGSTVAEIYPDIQNENTFFRFNGTDSDGEKNRCLSVLYDDMTGKYEYDYNCNPTAYAFIKIDFRDGAITEFNLYRNSKKYSEWLKNRLK